MGIVSGNTDVQRRIDELEAESELIMTSPEEAGEKEAEKCERLDQIGKELRSLAAQG